LFKRQRSKARVDRPISDIINNATTRLLLLVRALHTSVEELSDPGHSGLLRFEGGLEVGERFQRCGSHSTDGFVFFSTRVNYPDRILVGPGQDPNFLLLGVAGGARAICDLLGILGALGGGDNVGSFNRLFVFKLGNELAARWRQI
jgi:hypothetical protein